MCPLEGLRTSLPGRDVDAVGTVDGSVAGSVADNVSVDGDGCNAGLDLTMGRVKERFSVGLSGFGTAQYPLCQCFRNRTRRVMVKKMQLTPASPLPGLDARVLLRPDRGRGPGRETRSGLRAAPGA